MSTIYDQVHGYINISEFQNIIDTPEFQRLRNIKQLGACNYVFPSATGTRFEHSIGVYYLTDRIIKAILKNTSHLTDSLISKDKYRLIRLAALIHDLGHGPFSHLWDDLCIKNGNHEDHEFRGIEIFKWMNTKYSLNYSHDDIEFLSELVNPDIMKHPHKHHDCWMYQIVANKESGLDTDKMDYLIRDSRVVGLDINKDLEFDDFNFDYTKDEIKVLKKIAEWPKCIEAASLRLEPHRIPVYLYELASEFHSYWSMGKDDPSKRFINDKKEIPMDKLIFLKVISNVIKLGMNIVGVNTPEKM